MAYKRLAIIGPASLVIDLHLALLPIDVHLPIGPKQGAFTIHLTHSMPSTSKSSIDGHQFRAKFGKIGAFQYVPAQIMWREIHLSICSEDQLANTSLAEILHKQLGAVNFSLRWCQVDVSQHKCLCFDIDIKHEESLPILLHCESFQLTVQHQCPSADTFRAEIPLTESETRRDHWNKVIAQQMIPKEGRVSHVSFEQDRKQAARRYYDLRSATIDSCNDCTNVITFSSQSPSWFFSPKELNISLKERLHEVNYCDNSFIKESFTTVSNLSSLNLNHHEFPKYRDHGRWILCHIFLGPGQRFNLKSVHFVQDKWKVRYYDELIIRTFEQASMFITLPPGVSISQILDNVEWCQLQECYTVEDPRSHQPPTSQSQTGLRGQYINTTPSKHFVNGHGLSYASHNGVRSPACASSHEKGPIYSPPFQHVRERGEKTHSNDSDVDMTPAHINIVPKNDQGVKPHPHSTKPKCKDAAMECCPTAIDPEEADASQVELTSPCYSKDPGEAKPRTAEESFDHGSLVDADATNVGDPRLAHPHPVHPGVPAQNRNASSDSPGHTEDDCHVHLTHDITEVPNAALRASHDQKNAVNNTIRQRPRLPQIPYVIFLPRMLHFNHNPVMLLTSLRMMKSLSFMKLQLLIHYLLITFFVNMNRVETTFSPAEKLSGWPGSFAHADIEFFSKLATCYMIQFPSFHVLCRHSFESPRSCPMD